MSMKVLIANDYLLVDPSSYFNNLCKIEIYTPLSKEEWIIKIKQVYILIVEGNLKIDKEKISANNNLKMIQTISIGTDKIDIQESTKRGIIVCNVEEVVAESVAQLTWALILALTRRIPKADYNMRKGYFMKPGKWGAMEKEDMYFYRGGPLLWGKTLGLVGLGHVGSRVSLKALHAFNMKILVYDPYINLSRAQMYGATLVELEHLLKESDIVSIHCPLTDGTKHLIGKKELQFMKKTSFIVNTSRGPIIDEEALVECLTNNAIAGAALDTYEQEPLSSNSPLLKLENTILTPHNGSVVESLQQMQIEAFKNVIRYIKGERVNWITNPGVLDK